ncbi:MAG: CHAT domain-containing tetratricopeptide repeat protein [Cyanobacteria bacterium J06626_23]
MRNKIRNQRILAAVLGLGLWGSPWITTAPIGAKSIARGAPPLYAAVADAAEGDRLFEQQQYAAALAAYEAALQTVEQASSPATQRRHLLRQISRALLLLERYEEAIAPLRALIEIHQAAEYRTEPELSNLGLAYYRLGRYDQAETVLKAAITGWESVRSQTDADLDRVTLFEQQAYTYNLLQRVLVEQGQIEAALVWAERSRGRALADVLTDGQATLPTLSDLRQVARQEQATVVTYSILTDGRRILGNETDTETALLIWVVSPNGHLAFKQISLSSVWQDFSAQIENLSPLASLVQVSRSDLGVGNRGFGDFDWTLASTRRPTNAPDLEAQSLKLLHQLLIAPIADALPADPNAQVIFVPEGALFLVPFAALRDPDGTYLAEQHTLSVSPSFQTLQLTQSDTPFELSQSALVVGNPVSMPTLPGATQPLPTLPGAEAEAVAIATLLNVDPLIATEATEPAILAAIAEPQILHFATHGLLDFDAQLNEFGLPTTAEIPTRSETGVIVTPGAVIVGDNVRVGGISAEIALAQERVVRVNLPGVLAFAPEAQTDGWLSAETIAALDLNAELVVLSACNTGRGRITGDGIVGLSRAFIVAGAPSVVVSLWQVPDLPTAMLMTEFYRQLQQGDDKASALRTAMLAVKDRHPDPKNWAGFVLMGQVD